MQLGKIKFLMLLDTLLAGIFLGSDWLKSGDKEE